MVGKVEVKEEITSSFNVEFSSQFRQQYAWGAGGGGLIDG